MAKGDSVTKHWIKATSVYKGADGKLNLADTVVMRMTKQGLREARIFYEKACDLKSEDGCFQSEGATKMLQNLDIIAQ